MKASNAVSLIEAAYKLDLSTDEWLGQIAAAASAAFESSQGAMAFRYDASSGDWVNSGFPALHGLSPEFARDFFDQGDAPKEAGAAMAQIFKSVRFGSSREVFERLQATTVCAVFDRYGIDDMVGVNGLDPTGRGCMLVVAARRQAHAPRTVQLWHRLAAHISAGNRLRAILETLPQDDDLVNRAEAVLAPSGKIEHATGLAEPRSAREALHDALIRIDKARAERDDAQRSVDLWRGLVAGRWSLVEHFERDGKRYFLAQKNDPELREDLALTPRERQVLAYAELGHSNKLISYALGLSSSTVSTLLARARRKVGSQQ
jgi:hypothetical protein